MTNGIGNGENVIAMAQAPQQLRYPALSQIEGYWQALRRGRLVPDRSELDPRGMDRALDTAFVLETIAPGHGRFRVSGSTITDLLGMEVRGMPLSALFGPAARPALAEILQELVYAPATADLRLRSGRAIGKPVLEGQMRLFPLRAETGEINRILGCIGLTGAIGRTPRRFDITHSHLCRLTGTVTPVAAADLAVDDMPVATPDPDPVPDPVGGFVETARAFLPAPRQKGHLRLVVSN